MFGVVTQQVELSRKNKSKLVIFTYKNFAIFIYKKAR